MSFHIFRNCPVSFHIIRIVKLENLTNTARQPVFQLKFCVHVIN